MKAIFAIIMAVLPLAVTGNTIRTYDINYNVKNFRFHESQGITYISSADIPVIYSSEISQPSLPLVNIRILIGPSENIEHYDFYSSEEYVSGNITLAHNQPVYSYVNENKERVAPDSMLTNQLYPDSLVRFYGIHTINGYRYASFIFSPFTYRPKEKRLAINKLKLKLHISNLAVNKEEKAQDTRLIKEMVINPNDLSALYKTLPYKFSNTEKSNATDYDYIIVTCDSLKEIFQDLANWKTQKGIKTKIVTVEEIYAQTLPSLSNQLRIKQVLSNYYDGGMGCKYILLGGDYHIIPTYNCFLQFNHAQSSGVLTRFCPSDLFYGSYNHLNWDINGNYLNGEISDNIDPSPSVSISRIPVYNKENAGTIVRRIIDYEKAVYLDKWKNNIMLFGANTDSFAYMPHKSISHYFCDTIYNSDISSSGMERFRYYDTDTDYPEGALYDLHPLELQTEMEKGYHFIYSDLHGFKNSWTLEQSSYAVANAMSFTNPIYSHFITTACWTNHLDDETSLSKAFFRNSNSGILSYFGSSVESWMGFTPLDFDYSEFCSHKYFQSLLGTSNNYLNYRRLGDIVKEVKERIIIEKGIETYETPYRWLLFSMNVLGDPEMPIYTTRPLQQDGITCSFSNGVLNINTPYSPSSLAEICIMSLIDNGTSVYSRSSICYNQSYSLPSGEYSICITKPGCIPLLFYVGNTLHIQNERITGNVEMAAENIIIGSDITTLKPEGAVTIRNGKTNINATSHVTIKNNFEVKRGATLDIVP